LISGGPYSSVCQHNDRKYQVWTLFNSELFYWVWYRYCIILWYLVEISYQNWNYDIESSLILTCFNLNFLSSNFLSSNFFEMLKFNYDLISESNNWASISNRFQTIHRKICRISYRIDSTELFWDSVSNRTKHWKSILQTLAAVKCAYFEPTHFESVHILWFVYFVCCSSHTVCFYYYAGVRYGQTLLTDACVSWLKYNLLLQQSADLLRDIR